MASNPSRGIRNNNPGNIDRNHIRWQGMADDQSGDPRFVVFKAPEWGIRAIAKLLLTYQHQHGCNTIRKIINRWAPPNENDTSAYVAVVARRVGVAASAVIDVDQVSIMLPLVKAIITHENGRNPYSDATITEGLRLAGVVDAPVKPLMSQKSFVAQIATGGAVCCAAVAPYSAPLKSAADQLAAFTGAPVIGNVTTVLLTVAGLCAFAGILASWLKHKAAV